MREGSRRGQSSVLCPDISSALGRARWPSGRLHVVDHSSCVFGRTAMPDMIGCSVSRYVHRATAVCQHSRLPHIALATIRLGSAGLLHPGRGAGQSPPNYTLISGDLEDAGAALHGWWP